MDAYDDTRSPVASSLSSVASLCPDNICSPSEGKGAVAGGRPLLLGWLAYLQ